MRANNSKFPVLISSLAIFILISGTTPISLSQILEQQQTSTETGSKLTGTNLDLSVNPSLPFDKTASKNVTLSFLAKTKDLEGASISPGKIDHLDYGISITKDGNQIWSKQFHDHDGNLTLQIKPSTSGSVIATGGTEGPGQSTTGPYIVEGPLLIQDGNYSISAQIVGIEFNPLPSPLSDIFNLQVLS